MLEVVQLGILGAKLPDTSLCPVMEQCPCRRAVSCSPLGGLAFALAAWLPGIEAEQCSFCTAESHAKSALTASLQEAEPLDSSSCLFSPTKIATA